VLCEKALTPFAREQHDTIESHNMKGTGWDENKRIRYYGSSGPVVILLHGGPAAYGDLGDMASNLVDSFRVIEPWQRASGDTPLTVDIHIQDLHNLVTLKCPDKPPAIVGHSWGAMLALCYAAAYPDRTGPIALVGCGTFDNESRSRMKEIFDERMDPETRLKVKNLEVELDDPGERLVEKYKIIGRLQEYEHIPRENVKEQPFDKRAHRETWDDMVRLMNEGVYPATFASIKTPVIMLHGSYDPHPGEMIYSNLKEHIPQLEYCEFDKCGHYPWREKHASESFYHVLRNWLVEKSVL